MRLLLVTQDFPPVEGGMAAYYAGLVAGFEEEEIIVSTVAAEGRGETPVKGVPVLREPFPLARAHRPLSLRRWRKDLAMIIEYLRPEVLLCGNIRPLGPVVAGLSRRFGIPWYLIVHGNDLLAAHRRWRGWRRPRWNSLWNGVAGWAANSRAVRDLGVAVCGVDAARALVVHPEVDTLRFRPPGQAGRSEARRRFGIPDGGLVLLFVGRLVERKGLDRLLESLPRVVSPAAWRLVVSGLGDLEPYRRMAGRHGVAERVLFLGAVSHADLPALYRAADVAVMPSRTIEAEGDVEGFGIVYLEAAATGLAAIAGDSGGAAEAVLDGVTGLVVDGTDPLQIALAISRLLGDRAWRDSLGAGARRRVELEFGPGSMARKWKAFLESGVSSASPAWPAPNGPPPTSGTSG